MVEPPWNVISNVRYRVYLCMNIVHYENMNQYEHTYINEY